MSRPVLAAILLGICTPLLHADGAAAAERARPNIVLLESDDHHPDSLGCMGEPVKTPHIDRIAARGTLFRNHICQGLSCSPSRNALLTGSYPHNTGVYHNQDGNMEADVWTVAAALQRAGYTTALVGKHHFKPSTAVRSIDRTPDQAARDLNSLGFEYVHVVAGKVAAATGRIPPGADPYRDSLREHGLLEKLLADYRENRSERFSSHASALPEEHHHDTYIGTEAVRFIEQHDSDDPFFLWVDFVAPHPPADPPAPYHAMYDPEQMREPFGMPDRETLRGPLRRATSEDFRRFRASYYAMITHLDVQVGRVVDALEKAGKLENTLIVFAGDQGSMLGDHGKWGKGEFYRGSVNSPLVVAGPGVRGGTVVDRPVELIDLAPTFLDLAGAAEEDRRHSYGESLVPLLTGEGEYPRRYAFAELHDRKMVVDERYKYVLAEETVLFDLQNDPQELKNLAGTRPEVESRLKQAIADWLESTPPVRPPNPRPVRNRRPGT